MCYSLMKVQTKRKCRVSCGLCCGFLGILCVAAAFLMDEITRVDLTDTNTYSICGHKQMVTCLETDCADPLIGTLYIFDEAFAQDVATSDTTLYFTDIASECSDNKDAYCQQQTIGFIWWIVTICAMAFGACGAVTICIQKLRACTSPCFISALLTSLGFVAFILMSKQDGICWQEETEKWDLAASSIFSIYGALFYLFAAIVTCCLHKLFEEDWYGDL
eukprot:407529_1